MNLILKLQRNLNKIQIKYLKYLLYHVLFKPLKSLYKIDIGLNCKLGTNILIPHGFVVLGAKSIGDNVKIHQFTTLGCRKYGIEDYPTIENNVIIYSNCVILGNIIVGENSIIGAGSIVTKNIPPNSRVIGYNIITKLSKN